MRAKDPKKDTENEPRKSTVAPSPAKPNNHDSTAREKPKIGTPYPFRKAGSR